MELTQNEVVKPVRTLTLVQWAGFFSMLFGNFMAILDIQIVGGALRDIQGGISASVDEMSWVQGAYLIAEVISIPLSGFMSRVLSIRGHFLLSAVGFTLMSVASGFAWNIQSMIVFRALQGFFGGGMIPTTFSAIYLLFPAEKTMLAQVWVSIVSTLAPVVGPTIGGYLTDALSWHWLFLINVVPGIIVSFGVWFCVRIDKPDWSLLTKIDYLGMVVMSVFLGTMEYVLEEGPRYDWFDDADISTAAAVSVIAAVMFFWRAWTHPNPIVSFSAFRNRNFILASCLAVAIGVTLYGSSFVFPLYLGQVRGYSSLQIGELMAASGVVMLCAGPVAGHLTKWLPKKMMLALGMAMLAGCSLYNTQLTGDWGFYEFLLPQVLWGAGLVFSCIPLGDLAMSTLPERQIKTAGALFSLMRNLGGAAGLAVLNTLLISRQAYHWQQIIPAINLGRQEVTTTLEAATNTMATIGSANPIVAATLELGQRVSAQALVLSFNDLFMVITVLMVVTLCMMPFITETNEVVKEQQ
ncbi:DHA2 family efflux MFS transporter permease subunit [Chromobacterium haemolyticum]|uniref:DHA2 family efflux MFS transporter permease subunit n=1 Tax=Chromobacterium haemolyticum TaxID=394935 RepID=UPI00244AD4AC|nr:DHA2 family efflux MFS transporter permease subunit [Chromobacterium haemolyticum]MDH0342100.1 DHA2 family efflux MFS transporter permease subunit [Chromobacterium haemolyticum]